jgi:peptidyl-prolyl cis-trans isomerase B (cyclophilin B)
VAGSRRERELARAKYERQQARRAAAVARVRRRAQIGAAVVAVLVVFGGVFALSRTVDRDDATSAAETVETPSPTAAAKPTGDCTYTKLPGGNSEARFVGLPPGKADTTGSYTAKISTNQGEIAMEMFADKAPCAVNSFGFLAGKGFFDGTRCHRMLVGAEGILQCGDPSGTGRGGPGYSFADENLDGATYPRGTVAMANSGKDTNGSQFFLVFQASAFPPNYTPFGRITSGLDILDRVAKGGTQGEQRDEPKTNVVVDDVIVSKR